MKEISEETEEILYLAVSRKKAVTIPCPVGEFRWKPILTDYKHQLNKSGYKAKNRETNKRILTSERSEISRHRSYGALVLVAELDDGITHQMRRIGKARSFAN